VTERVVTKSQLTAAAAAAGTLAFTGKDVLLFLEASREIRWIKKSFISKQ